MESDQAITMQFKQGYIPREDALRRMVLERGYEIATGTLSISCRDGRAEWRFVAVGLSRKLATRISELSLELGAFEGMESYQIAHARN